jgi:transposase InsO family protein
MMLDAVEKRFGAVRAPHPIEHLSDNGSPYTAKQTRDFAAALNLIPCFTPVKSPESKVGSLRQNPQARLCSHQSFAGRRDGASANRRMVRRLQ